MKTLLLAFAIFSSSFAFAQHKPLSHGIIYGSKPNTSELIEAPKLDAFMGTKPRISTSIRGVVVKVTKNKGGWFEISAGNGKVIAAHFSKYDITIPTNLVGHTVIAEGIAARQFMADDSQHLAGQKAQHATNPKQLTFEVTGLMVEK
ncbi:MAG: DUF4920 domain-containing protein [Sphingobacteriales bacterium]